MAMKKNEKTTATGACIVYAPDPKYCGVGAGGVQFAYGKAEVQPGWVLDWYRERGYKIEPKEAPEEAPSAPTE